MSAISTVFQYEVRYNHILNFSQIARELLSPFVQLADSIKLENQNSIEERIIFSFEEEDYIIIVGWDRILLKGQGAVSRYTEANSAIETPFLAMLEKIKDLEEFGTIRNVLLAINYINELDYTESELVDKFSEMSLNGYASNVLEQTTDVAITLENKVDGDEMTVSYGPYFGKKELMTRQMLPNNMETLEGVDIIGTMFEYKHFKHASDVNFSLFKEMVRKSNETIERICQNL